MADFSVGRRSVLCVQADDESRTLISEVLSDHDLVLAGTAYEALRHVNARAFHGYVLDYFLPDLMGTTLCREIRKLDPNAPILFCAAAALDRHKMRALSAGASAYLCKPIRPEILRSKLLALLGLADMESLSAKVAEERAIQEELEVRVRLAVSRADAGRQLSASSIERTAKARALKAFIEARGTRGLFESWWPGVFRSAWANRP